MARYVVEDDGIPGLTLALRLRLKGHDVSLVPGVDRHNPGETFTLPAPYRDLFLKTGGPLEDSATLVQAPGHAAVVSGSTVTLPAVGPQSVAVTAAFGSAAGTQWAALMRDAAEVWSRLRTDDYRSTASLRRRVRRTLRDRRLHTLIEGYIEGFGLDPACIGDAAIVLPYLDQTFGRWTFADGMEGFEQVLRSRCAEMGVRFSPDAGELLSLDAFWARQFATPTPRWRKGAIAPVATHELGLPWIGMAAEFIADRVGRAPATPR
jgi:hypothetical protein